MPRPNKGIRMRWIERRKSYYAVWYEQGVQRLRSLKTDDERKAKEGIVKLKVWFSNADKTAADFDVGIPTTTVFPVSDDGRGFVYFMGASVGLVKIGYTTNLKQRIAELQTGSPVALGLLAAVRGWKALEESYHKKFARFRMHGEWFALVGEVRLEIEELNKSDYALDRNADKFALPASINVNQRQEARTQ